MVIGLNERSRCVDVPFDVVSQIRSPEMVELGQNVKKQRFSKYELVWARTFERKVIETWLQAQMEDLGV